MATERQTIIRELRPNSIRIRLHSAIGQGLSAQVYRGVREDSRGFTRQPVAVKITKNVREASVLRREFETLLQVQSPHLVRVFAWDDHGDESLLSMEYIDGLSLSVLVESGRLDSGLVDEIITQAQDGLRALAEKSLAHGDLSPNNILVARCGTVKLIDFANPDRQSGFVQGTPPYMAPEVWQGKSGDIKSDLFSLGLLEMDLVGLLECTGHVVPSDVGESRERCLRAASEMRHHPWLAPLAADRTFVERTSSIEVKGRLASLVAELKSLELGTQDLFCDSDQIKSARPIEILATSTASANKLSTDISSSLLEAAVAKRPALHLNISFSPTVFRWISVFSGILIGFVSTALWSHVSRSPDAVEPRHEMQVMQRQDQPSSDPSFIAMPHREPSLANGSLSIRTLHWMRFQFDGREIGYSPIRLGRLKPGRYLLRWQSSRGAGKKWIEISAGQALALAEKDFPTASYR